MTREEAIDILRSYLMFDKSNMQIDMALNMAIEALQKDTVKIPLPKYVTLGEDSTVEPIGRPHGEWLESVNDDYGHMTSCSNCGMDFCDSEINIKELSWHFCPNCGSDNRSKEDDGE